MNKEGGGEEMNFKYFLHWFKI